MDTKKRHFLQLTGVHDSLKRYRSIINCCLITVCIMPSVPMIIMPGWSLRNRGHKSQSSLTDTANTWLFRTGFCSSRRKQRPPEHSMISFSSDGVGFVCGVTYTENPANILCPLADCSDESSRNLNRFSAASSKSRHFSGGTKTPCSALICSHFSDTMCLPRAIALRNLHVRYTWFVTKTVHSDGVWTMVPPRWSMLAA